MIGAVVGGVGRVEHGQRDGLGLGRVDDTVGKQLAIGANVVAACRQRQAEVLRKRTRLPPPPSKKKSELTVISAVVGGVRGAQHRRTMVGLSDSVGLVIRINLQ